MTNEKASGVTFTLIPRPQSIAAAWLRDTREWRPARDVIEAGDAIGPELRKALVEWMNKGSKRSRRKGAKVVKDPWSAPPPSMKKDAWYPLNAREQRAHMLFLIWRLERGLIAQILSQLPTGSRGRRKTPRTMACEHVAKELGVDVRTAQDWYARFVDLAKKARHCVK